MPAVTLISSVPEFASQEEHASSVGSTPNSFSDINPVLKHKEANVSISFEPPVEGFDSTVQGTLYVVTRQGSLYGFNPSDKKMKVKNSSILAFMPHSGPPGFQIQYPAITLHAISRGESGPSIYCQLDESYGNSDSVPANEEAECGNEDTQMRELIVVPQLPESGAFIFYFFLHFTLHKVVIQLCFSVEAIFESLSRCASLHPDPLDQEDDQEDYPPDDALVDESAFETFNGDESDELSEVGRVRSDFINDNRYAPY